MACSIFSHALPAIEPKKMRTKFHISVPENVIIRNLTIFIFVIPAGIEIRLLIIGINLQKKTE